MRFLVLLLLLLTIGCSSEPPAPAPVPVKKKTAAPKPVEPPKPKVRRAPRFNDKNAAARLTAYGEKNPETICIIHTDFGNIKIRLYKDTPLHRANFIMLAKKGYFDGTQFMRVVPGFIAQGGSAGDEDNAAIKQSIGKYSIPNEISKRRFHKKGALGAARSYYKNPDKRSNPYHFYLVEGTKYYKNTLKAYEEENKYKYSQAQKDYYNKNNGAAHIDGQHTVFGEIVSGFSVVPKLTSVETDSREWPLKDIIITKVEVVK